MPPSVRRAAVMAAAVAVLGACSAGPSEQPDPAATSDVGSPADPGPSEDTRGSRPAEARAFARIPTAVRRGLPRTPALRPVWRNRAEFLADEDGTRQVLVQRRMAPCDRGGLWLSLDADRDLLDYAESVRRDGDLLVSQQLTLYPDAAAADAFLAEAADKHAACGRVDGRRVREASFADFATAGELGRQDLATSTLVSDTVYDVGARRVVLQADTLVRRRNAVLWTRVVDLDAVGSVDGASVGGPARRGLERASARATGRARDLLDRLRAPRVGR